jgi:hypothetical protein
VKLVAELPDGVTREVEVARLERSEEAELADFGLRLAEAKQLTAALQAEMSRLTVVGERCRWCGICGGYYPATFRSLFGAVPVRVRRLLSCLCQGSEGVKSFAVLDLAAATVAPELAYVTARYAALVPFGKAATLLSELLPISGAANAGTVRKGRPGRRAVAFHPDGAADRATAGRSVVVGLDGGYVRCRHRQEERHFEVIAANVFHADGNPSRFAFARNGPTIASDAFKQALAVAGHAGRHTGQRAVRW